MSLKKKPVNGMKDILPDEMRLRDYVQRIIKECYLSFGFNLIETPCMEAIENLSSRQGGENERLIFRILKRGEKLSISEAKDASDLVDMGMRYDLTVPLCRYYANNANDLPTPFKALQMGNVWRADRPQRGRFRQFMQCDIDVLGEAGELAEIELILATAQVLSGLGFLDFTVRINDRRILKAVAEASGFPDESFDVVCIILDKMDKIGKDGVAGELAAAGFRQEEIKKCLKLLGTSEDEKDALGALMRELGGTLNLQSDGQSGDILDPRIGENLERIIEAVRGASDGGFSIVFDPTLVRGMSYYTGAVFEIETAGFGGSIGGGGRYDKMAGSFAGRDVPACGISLGFERIIMLLIERGFEIPGQPEKKAYLIEKGIAGDRFDEIIRQAMAERSAGRVVLLSRMNKNKKFQKEQLAREGYGEFEEFFRS